MMRGRGGDIPKGVEWRTRAMFQANTAIHIRRGFLEKQKLKSCANNGSNNRFPKELNVFCWDQSRGWH